MSDSQFAGVVDRWIEIAQQPMPREPGPGRGRRNVAAYVASVAGTSPESAPSPCQSDARRPGPAAASRPAAQATRGRPGR